MTMYYNLYNKLCIEVKGRSCGSSRLLIQKYDRYMQAIENKPNEENEKIILNFQDRIDAPVLNFVGKEAAFCNEDFYILDNRGAKFRLNFDALFSDGEFLIEESFNFNDFYTIFESTILIKLCKAGLIPIHSSSISYEGSGILFPAWGGAGKTRILLKLIELGGKFVSDEWSIINGNEMYTYCKDFLLMDYDMSEFPQHAKLSVVEKIRLKLNNNIRFSMARTFLNHFNLLLRSKSYNLLSLFPEMCPSVKLDKVYFLQRCNQRHITKKEIPLDQLIEKIYQSFVRENRVFFHYYNLSKFAHNQREDYLEHFEKRYKMMLFETLRYKECFFLEVPDNLSNVSIEELI